MYVGSSMPGANITVSLTVVNVNIVNIHVNAHVMCISLCSHLRWIKAQWNNILLVRGHHWKHSISSVNSICVFEIGIQVQVLMTVAGVKTCHEIMPDTWVLIIEYPSKYQQFQSKWSLVGLNIYIYIYIYIYINLFLYLFRYRYRYRYRYRHTYRI